MKAPPPFAALLTAHNHAMDRHRRILSIPFQRRALWLLKQIKREIPQITGLDYCNGDHWFAPADAQINCRSGDETTKERLRNVLDMQSSSGWLPDVSAKCLAHIRELSDLTAFSAYSQLHTVNPMQIDAI